MIHFYFIFIKDKRYMPKFLSTPHRCLVVPPPFIEFLLQLKISWADLCGSISEIFVPLLISGRDFVRLLLIPCLIEFSGEPADFFYWKLYSYKFNFSNNYMTISVCFILVEF